MGVISDCQRCLMRAAVSKPSIVGMQTSSRMTAKSWSVTQRRAASPESASTMGKPSGASTALIANLFAGLSSTTRMGTRSAALTTHARRRATPGGSVSLSRRGLRLHR